MASDTGDAMTADDHVQMPGPGDQPSYRSALTREQPIVDTDTDSGSGSGSGSDDRPASEFTGDQGQAPVERTRPVQDQGQPGPSNSRSDPDALVAQVTKTTRVARASRLRVPATGTDSQGSDSLRWLVWLIRSAVLILPIAALAGGVMWLALRTLLSVTTPETTTVTRIVLTDEVRWPFFDTVIEEASSLARGDELVQVVAGAFPGGDYILEPSVPTAVDAAIDITVISEDRELSRQASILAADWVIEQHEGRRFNESRAELVPLQTERDRVIEQKAAEEATADQILRDQQLTTDESELGRLDRELRLANNAVSFYDSELLRLESAINELNGTADSLQQEIAIASTNTTTSTEDASSLPFQAGVATFLLSAFGLFVANREFGRFGDAKHLQSVLEVPVVTWTSSQANVQLARLVRLAQDEVSCQIVGFDSEITTPSATAVSTALADMGLPAEYLRPGDTPANPDGVYLQAAGDGPLRSDTLKDLVWCDAILLVADSKHDSIRSLRRRLRCYREMGIPPLAIISVDRDRTGPRYPITGLR